MLAGKGRLRVCRQDAARIDRRRFIGIWRQRSIERCQILGDGPSYAFPGTKLDRSIGRLQLLLTAGIDQDRAAVYRDIAPRHQLRRSAPCDHLLEQRAMHVTGTEATMPVLGGCGVVGHPVRQIEPVEPTRDEVEMHLLAQAAFRADADR